MDISRSRQNMIDGQITVNQIDHPSLLAAMAMMPRERFLPSNLQTLAYSDAVIDLAAGGKMPPPLVQAKLLQAASLAPGDSVLIVAANCGYMAALASQMAGFVYALTQSQDQADHLSRLAVDLALDNLACGAGDLMTGYPEQGPYQAILVEGSLCNAPVALDEQLADGGCLVYVRQDRVGQLARRVSHGGYVSEIILEDLNAPLLDEKPEGFSLCA